MRHLILTILSALVLLSGCVSFSTTADWDPSADFRRFKSFNFSQSFDEIKLNDLDKRRIKSAVTVEMEKRGYQLSDTPDLLINGYVTSKEKVVVTNTHYSGMPPYMWGPWYTSTDVNSYVEGTLLVSVIDIKQKKLIWEGRVEGVVNSTGGDKRTREINEMIQSMYRKYPI